MKVYRRKRGDILQAGRFPWPVVTGLKMKAREWSGQYQQNPAPETGVIFNPAWWRYYKADALPEFELVALSVDCAFKSGKENDLVAIHKWGVIGPRSYLLDRHTEHLGYVGTKAAIKAMQRHGRPASTILVEDKANGSAVIEELKSDPDFGAAVIAIDPQGDKKSRAHAASTDVEAGNVFLPQDAEWVAPLLRTAAAFPAVKHDDDIDAMSQFLNWRRSRNNSLGVVDYFKALASGARKLLASVEERLLKQPREGKLVAFGDRQAPQEKKKAAEQARFEGYARLKGKPELCGLCGVEAVGQHPDGYFKTFCRQCGAVNGVAPVKPIENNQCPVEGCAMPMVMSGGMLRCQNHGQPVNQARVVGMTFAQLKRRRTSFGRFG